ncbi:hypothetical protein HMPREF9238_01266 [Gleimia europaea ACS-120-V-Col10b]|uniref:Uncharacterized protein n=1 Tax=Gleimia europaea ACS-120-V-Col10b TaxID=883069 RepID=A0A9W5VX27_9ACTO|nr:hypothetical protein HMPREF9238_01266 [Gleimia europaea ACS-120-V-Col10b]
MALDNDTSIGEFSTRTSGVVNKDKPLETISDGLGLNKLSKFTLCLGATVVMPVAISEVS